jgi:DNA-binding transcriptional LysR family regulator
MTAAARAINVTQSAASAAIAALEDRHGVKLFDRVGRNIVLTEAGRAFLDEARAVLARARAAELVLDDLSGLRRGTLRLVASQTIAAYWLPPVLASFRAAHKLLTVELAIGNSEAAAARVHDGQAEVGFIEGAIEDPALARWQVGEDRLLLVQAAPMPGPVDTATLAGARWVMREQGSGTRSTFDAAMRQIGIDPVVLDVALVLPSNESVRTAVEAGAGIAALSALVVAQSLAAGTLHALPFDLGTRLFYGLRHKERYRSKAADALLAMINGLEKAAT